MKKILLGLLLLMPALAIADNPPCIHPGKECKLGFRYATGNCCRDREGRNYVCAEEGKNLICQRGHL